MKRYIQPSTTIYDLLFDKDVADAPIGNTSSGTNYIDTRRMNSSSDGGWSAEEWSSHDEAE